MRKKIALKSGRIISYFENGKIYVEKRYYKRYKDVIGEYFNSNYFVIVDKI